jgi:hypothetical protein
MLSENNAVMRMNIFLTFAGAPANSLKVGNMQAPAHV